MKKIFVIAIAITLVFTSSLSASSLRETRVSLGAALALGLASDSGYFTDGVLASTEATFEAQDITFAAEASVTATKAIQVFDTALLIMRDAYLNEKVSLFIQAGPALRFISHRGVELSIICRGGMRYNFVNDFELMVLAGVRVATDGTLGVDLKAGLSYKFD